MDVKTAVSNSHRTAISRPGLSAPVRWLKERGLLRGQILDYGCGRGKDAQICRMTPYDPHYFPDKPDRKFDTIVCQYVLNVVDEATAGEIVRDLRSLVRKDGRIYVVVRRDIREAHVTKRGTYQRPVYLDADIVCENSSFCIYCIVPR